MRHVYRTRAVAARLTALAGPLIAARAQATCVEPPLELLWTYPSEGARDVPLNAELWVMTSLWGGEVAATLNGAALGDRRLADRAAWWRAILRGLPRRLATWQT